MDNFELDAITHRYEMIECPHCKGKIDASTSADQIYRVPVEGDFSICFHCGEIGVFTKESKLRKPTIEDLQDVPIPVLMEIAWHKANIQAFRASEKAKRN